MLRTKTGKMNRLGIISLVMLAAGLVQGVENKNPAVEQPHSRQPMQDVNSRDVREEPGLRPGENLLFNGWGVSPAGRQVPVGDMALKMVIAPDQRRLVAVHGGFNQHGVTLIDLAKGEETQFLPLRKGWNGLAFSPDGKRFFVSGGDSGEIHVFNYADGQASFDRSEKPAADESEIFLAGLTVRPDSGRIYVCNEAHHEIWVLNGQTLALEGRIGVGMHPHSCLLGKYRRHLYVSDW